MMIDFLIDKLTELLIKQTFEDKRKGQIAYIKKVDAYRDLIDLLKKVKNYERS